MTFDMAPEKINSLNISASACQDFYVDPPYPNSAAASAVFFSRFKVEWTNKERELHLYALRFTAKSKLLQAGVFQTYITGTDFAALFGDIESCNYCVISPSASGKANGFLLKGIKMGTEHLTQIVEGVEQPKVKGCTPVVGGFKFKTGLVGVVTIPVNITLMGYSIDEEGNVTNEYATKTINITYEPPPLP